MIFKIIYLPLLLLMLTVSNSLKPPCFKLFIKINSNGALLGLKNHIDFLKIKIISIILIEIISKDVANFEFFSN
jgi:hypothetical protein